VIDGSDFELVSPERLDELPNAKRIPGYAGERVVTTRSLRQRMGVQHALDERFDLLAAKQVLHVFGGVPPRLQREAAIQEEERELQALLLSKLCVQALRRRLNIDVVEELKISGITEQEIEALETARRDTLAASSAKETGRLIVEDESDPGAA